MRKQRKVLSLIFVMVVILSHLLPIILPVIVSAQIPEDSKVISIGAYSSQQVSGWQMKVNEGNYNLSHSVVHLAIQEQAEQVSQVEYRQEDGTYLTIPITEDLTSYQDQVATYRAYLQFLKDYQVQLDEQKAREAIYQEEIQAYQEALHVYQGEYEAYQLALSDR